MEGQGEGHSDWINFKREKQMHGHNVHNGLMYLDNIVTEICRSDLHFSIVL